MRKRLKLFAFLIFVGASATVILTSFDKNPPEPGNECAGLGDRDGSISLSFSPYPNQFRNSGYEYYIPSPDMRWNDTPGQDPNYATNFYCTVTVTSPNCKSYKWNSSYESPGSILNIKLPPIGYDATIKVNYIEREENSSTENFNKPVHTNWGTVYSYSRVGYEFQQNYLGGGNGSTIHIQLSPTYNQGYDIDFLAGGKIYTYQLPDYNSKSSLNDISGINTYIEAKNMNYTGN